MNPTISATRLAELTKLYVGTQVRLTQPYSNLVKNSVGIVRRVDDEGDLVIEVSTVFVDRAQYQDDLTREARLKRLEDRQTLLYSIPIVTDGLEIL